MHRVLLFFIVCWLLLLDNVENSKLNKNQILSRLRRRSLSTSSTSITRQEHNCTSCFFIWPFSDPLVLPSDCDVGVTSSACDMTILIDYTYQEIWFLSFENGGSLIFDNITYDSSTSHYAYFSSADDDPFLHIFDYICATGDYCEWEYMRQIIPKLLLLDYQPMYQLLYSKIFNSTVHPSLIECYNNTGLVNCSSGTCNYRQSTDRCDQTETYQDCSIFDTSSIEFGVTQYFPGPTIHDYSEIDFDCDSYQCNDQSNADEIIRIISENANEYIYGLQGCDSQSSGIKLQWTNFIFYFFILISIRKFSF